MIAYVMKRIHWILLTALELSYAGDSIKRKFGCIATALEGHSDSIGMKRKIDSLKIVDKDANEPMF